MNDITHTGPVTVPLAGIIERVLDDGAVLLRPDGAASPDDAEQVRALLATEAAPAPGDRGLVVTDARGHAYLIAVVRGGLSGARSKRTLRDERGRVLAEYDPGAGSLTVHARGDLTLCAPEGRITLASRDGVGLTTLGPVRIDTPVRIDARAGGKGRVASVALHPGAAELRAPSLRAACDRADLKSGAISVRASDGRADIGKLTLTLGAVRQRAREITTIVTGVLATHAGRIRQVAEGAFSLRSGRTTLRSRRDTKIDGEKIHLG